MIVKSGITYAVAQLVMLPIALTAVSIIVVWAVGMGLCQLGLWAWKRLDGEDCQ
ncbi:hypothetical protein [Methylomonas rapida]|uniref:Uncharacterized protein n=1 Tax=Methylomonas rapida TaxID=2963939 RepID=A0ABY7GR24_9GAMM|nr:hypothetical protein [Methylomonas rapida]WAR46940.1 hypothetical protein NM686_010635 [Methylomonas rapida]